MFDKVLTGCVPEKNKDYAERFRKLVEETSPLSYERTKYLIDSKPIIGQLFLGPCWGYEKFVALERLKGLKTINSDDLWLEVEHLDGIHGLDVGIRPGGVLEIFQEKYSMPYSLHPPPLNANNEYSWVEVPREFRVETHNLLKTEHYKNKFKCLQE